MLNATVGLHFGWRLIDYYLHTVGNGVLAQHHVNTTMLVMHVKEWYPTVQDLVRITGVNRSAVSRYVAELIREGLVAETIDPDDRRRRLLIPTAKGKEKNRQVVEFIKDSLQRTVRSYHRYNNGDGPPLGSKSCMIKMAERHRASLLGDAEAK